jgi:hypothetical protein
MFLEALFFYTIYNNITSRAENVAQVFPVS